MRLVERALPSLLSACMALWSAPVWSAPAEPEAVEADASDAADDEELDRARELFEKGKARYQFGDYDAAIELWTESYELVSKREDAQRVLADLTYNVMRAQRAAYDIDRDIQRLRTAKHLLDRSIGIYEAAQVDASTLADLRKERDELVSQIEAAERDAAAAQVDAPPSPTGEADTDQGSGGGKTLIIAGSVSAGLGVAGLGLMGAGMAMGSSSESTLADEGLSLEDQRNAIDRGLMANKLALAGGIAGGVLGITGAVLIGLGVKKQRAAKSAQLRIEPQLGTVTGLRIGGSF